jgi:hypothetical protein
VRRGTEQPMIHRRSCSFPAKIRIQHNMLRRPAGCIYVLSVVRVQNINRGATHSEQTEGQKTKGLSHRDTHKSSGAKALQTMGAAPFIALLSRLAHLKLRKSDLFLTTDRSQYRLQTRPLVRQGAPRRRAKEFSGKRKEKLKFDIGPQRGGKIVSPEILFLNL